MSFTIRYYDIDMLVEKYKEGGIDSVKNSFKRIDSMTFKDKESSKIYKLISEEKYKKAIKMLEKSAKDK